MTGKIKETSTSYAAGMGYQTSGLLYSLYQQVILFYRLA
jgi:hypothetical protein